MPCPAAQEDASAHQDRHAVSPLVHPAQVVEAPLADEAAVVVPVQAEMVPQVCPPSAGLAALAAEETGPEVPLWMEGPTA